MSLDEAFAPVEERYRAQVMADTWGHLAPQQGREYPGTVLFAHSIYGGDGSTVINTHFEDLPDSPWFYDGLGELILKHRHAHGDAVEGGVYVWSGVYELRITLPPLDEDGYPVGEDTHEHVWTGTFRTIVEPTGEIAS